MMQIVLEFKTCDKIMDKLYNCSCGKILDQIVS